MKLGKFGKKQEAQPTYAQELKELVKNSDKSLIITVKAGQVNIHAVKNVKYKYEVEGILTEGLRLYTINPILNFLSKGFDTAKKMGQGPQPQPRPEQPHKPTPPKAPEVVKKTEAGKDGK